MTTARRLWWGFGTLIVVLVIIAMGTAMWLRTLKNQLQEITAVAEPRSAAVYEMVNHAMRVGLDVLKYLETRDPTFRQYMLEDASRFARFKEQYDRLARRPLHRELGGRVGLLFGEYYELGRALIDAKDRQHAISTDLGRDFDAMEKIIDDGIQARLDPLGPHGPLKVFGIADLEVDIGEWGTWLGNYRYTSNPAFETRVYENAEAVKQELKSLKKLRWTPTERHWVGQLERHYSQTLSHVQELIGLHKTEQHDEQRFLDLLGRLDRLMDIHLRVATQSELIGVQDAAEEAVKRILVGALILLGVGVPIALGTSLTVGRGILKTEERITELLATERLYSDHQRQLTEASLTINSANTPEEVLEAARQEACKIIGARRCVVYGTGSDAPMVAGDLKATFQGQGGTTLGVVQLTDKIDGEFTDEDRSLFRQLTNMAGVAMENARLYEELERRDRRKDEFLATLAHELRSPLAPIGSALEILRLAPDDGATSTDARDSIERQFRHLVRLVDDLLDISRITRGKIQLRKKRVVLAEVVRSAIETSRPSMERYGHELTVTLPADPVWLVADSTRLAQAVANLLNNAAKYTPAGGRIMIDAERDGETVALKVQDNGIGIRAEALPQVFDLFAQVDTALERAQGGLGIGLFLVKKLIEMHGGTVDAYSAGRGKGAAFIVRLRVAAEGRSARDGTDEAPGGPLQPSRRILVVDDSRDTAENLGSLLRLMGHEVRIAFDGPTALDAIRSDRPELILLDIGLPGMHGYDVAEHIRKDPDLQNLVLAAVTGWGQEEDRRRAREAGFDYHLTKPLTRAVLEQLLRASSAGSAPVLQNLQSNR